MLGTWSYMAPEAYTGQPLDSRSDVWSLGVMLYEMLAGSLPFDGPTPMALMNAVLTAPPADLHTHRPDAPDALADLVYRMLSKAPGDRIP